MGVLSIEDQDDCRCSVHEHSVHGGEVLNALYCECHVFGFGELGMHNSELPFTQSYFTDYK